jgi:predicted metalloprotease with PDZ domain
MLAASAAQLDYKSGRWWRSTDDTAISASILRGGSPAWANWKRGQDYYQEGELLWLDADTLIRQLTGDKKSLTDFLQIFLAKGGNTGPLIVPYHREELIEDLNQVAPYDWANFLHQRVDMINPHADLDGIERGGYKLTYQDHPSDTARGITGRRANGGPLDDWYTVGFRVSPDATLIDVRWGSAADKAKLAPGYKLVAINGRVPSPDSLHQAIVTAKSSTEPIHLLVQSETYIKAFDIDYHDGERFPVLVRAEGTKDYLDEITKPLAKPPTK